MPQDQRKWKKKNGLLKMYTGVKMLLSVRLAVTGSSLEQRTLSLIG